MTKIDGNANKSAQIFAPISCSNFQGDVAFSIIFN